MNPTPYYLSLINLSLMSSANKSLASNEGGMIGPGETMSFPLKGSLATGEALQVHYQTINDYGGTSTTTATTSQEARGE